MSEVKSGLILAGMMKLATRDITPAANKMHPNKKSATR
jgi:hypothetical protein